MRVALNSACLLLLGVASAGPAVAQDIPLFASDEVLNFTVVAPLDDIFDRALRREPAERYASAAALAADIEHYLEGGRVRATGGAGHPAPGVRLRIVYAAADEVHRNRLVTQLEPVAREGILASTESIRLDAEGAWRERVLAGTAGTHVTLLLVSPDLIASGVLPVLASRAERTANPGGERRRSLSAAERRSADRPAHPPEIGAARRRPCVLRHAPAASPGPGRRNPRERSRGPEAATASALSGTP